MIKHLRATAHLLFPVDNWLYCTSISSGQWVGGRFEHHWFSYCHNVHATDQKTLNVEIERVRDELKPKVTKLHKMEGMVESESTIQLNSTTLCEQWTGTIIIIVQWNLWAKALFCHIQGGRKQWALILKEWTLKKSLLHSSRSSRINIIYNFNFKIHKQYTITGYNGLLWWQA